MKNVLRMKLHEKAEISDGESRTYLCEVEAYEEDAAVLHILEEMEADTEPASKLYLFQGDVYKRQVYKHQFKDLNDVIAQIKNRNYKFIIYMDDLSFEEFEIEYKYLKAVIEGGLEKKPDNILIYATSNRRHLVRETFKDKADRDEELHTNDTVQEKLSLVARFGVTIYFGKPDKKEFQKIVTTLADRYGCLLYTSIW